MGWKQRDWLLDVDPRMLFDTRGNIGPTVWWNGQVIGGWAVAPDGEFAPPCSPIAVRQPPRPSTAAHLLQTRLHGSVVSSSLAFSVQGDLLGGNRS
jgi:hypothetical protein